MHQKSMTNNMSLLLFTISILLTSFSVMVIPQANALTINTWDDSHTTARFGNSKVCGDHMCAPGEWDKLITALTAAQRSQQAGWTAAHTATKNSNATATYPPTPSTPVTSVSPAVCNSIESMLTSAGVSDSIVTQVMTDLGCSYK